MLLNVLVYDGKVEKTFSGDGNNMYRAIQPLLNSSGLIKAPCGVCPVRTFIAIYDQNDLKHFFFYFFYISFFILGETKLFQYWRSYPCQMQVHYEMVRIYR